MQYDEVLQGLRQTIDNYATLNGHIDSLPPNFRKEAGETYNGRLLDNYNAILIYLNRIQSHTFTKQKTVNDAYHFWVANEDELRDAIKTTEIRPERVIGVSFINERTISYLFSALLLQFNTIEILLNVARTTRKINTSNRYTVRN